MKHIKRILSAVSIMIFLTSCTQTTQSQIQQPATTYTQQFEASTLTQELTKAIQTQFDSTELDHVSVAIYIPNHSYTFYWNETLELENASTVKVPLNMYIYDLIKKDPSIATIEIAYSDIYYEDGAGIMQDSFEGELTDVQTLLTRSIRYSDNIATNMLLGYFIEDWDSFSELLPYFGHANFSQWTSTAADKLETLKILYNRQADYVTLIQDMESTIYNNRLPKWLPSDVVVALKTGDINDTIHDFGIVFSHDVDYLIVLSMHDIDNQDEQMANLSKTIYDCIISFEKTIE